MSFYFCLTCFNLFLVDELLHFSVGWFLSSKLGLEGPAQQSVLKVLLKKHNQHPTSFKCPPNRRFRSVYNSPQGHINIAELQRSITKRVFRIPNTFGMTSLVRNHLAFKLQLIYSRINRSIPEIKTCRIHEA